MSLSEHGDDRNPGDAALVAEALRLEAAGKSQRQIAAALGKPRHWVRFTALAKPEPAIGAADNVIAVPLMVISANPNSRAVHDKSVAALAESIEEIGLLEP